MFFIILFSLIQFIVADDTLIQTKNGPIKGFTGPFPWEDVRSFLGIPFAEPPIGRLRFKPPVSLKKTWTTPLKAEKFGYSCWQPSGFANTPVNEDCLTLNIWSPRANKIKEPLPVMVFLYGGGYDRGASSFPAYNGQNIINHGEKKVVVVTLNYRIRAFGFLGSRALQKASPDGTTGNMGLQDQRMALEWVRDNIAAFGGDPKKVTLWGESAGSGSVSNHLVIPKSTGLFHRAIMESGPIAHWIAHNLTAAEVLYQRLVHNTQCKRSTEAQEIACIQAVNASIIEHESEKLPVNYYLGWAPVIDGVELPENPQLLASKGKFSNRVPVLLGTNKNEGSLLVNQGSLHVKHDETPAEFKAMLDKIYGTGKTSETVYNLYNPSNYENAFWAAAFWLTDEAMTCPAQRTANWLTQAGIETHLYFFTHELEVLKLFYPWLGVFHGSELLFIFDLKTYDYVPLPLTIAERELQQTFVNYWTNFAHSGDPNVGPSSEKTHWPKWNEKTQPTFQMAEKRDVIHFNRRHFCDYFDKHFNITSF